MRPGTSIPLRRGISHTHSAIRRSSISPTVRARAGPQAGPSRVLCENYRLSESRISVRRTMSSPGSAGASASAAFILL